MGMPKIKLMGVAKGKNRMSRGAAIAEAQNGRKLSRIMKTLKSSDIIDIKTKYTIK